MLREKIDSWAEKCPERIAHHYRDNVLTYRELKEFSDALAIWLYNVHSRDDREEQLPVIVYGHKENEMLVSFLASIKSGHPYIPVDVSVPAERLRQIIEASGAKVILSPRSVPEEVKVEGLLIQENFALRTNTGFFERFLGEVPARDWQVREEEVYYIIFTSGSTGKPKGVQITLQALESYLNWVNPEYAPREMEEVFLNQAPFSFDLSVMDLYMSLSTGGTLWSIDKEQIANMRELFKSLGESGVTFWVSTPSFSEICLMDRSFNDELLPQVKRFLFCGEVLTHDCASKLVERFPQAKVENLYGPTEATVAVTTLTIDQKILDSFNPLPVGRAKSDCLVMICDSEQLTEALNTQAGTLEARPTELPEGERGELVIAGPNVSIGYLNNPEQTKKAFFTWQDGEGVLWQAYRTGDAGAWKDGVLFFYGRLDFQVKLHGYRIELGDIEENLRKVDWVDNAVVLPIERRGKVEYLQAFIKPNHPIEGEFAVTQALREELKKNLPEYMIPRRFIYVESMPMTPNGKVDRRALLGGL